MLAYIFRRLLLIIPTLLGILLTMLGVQLITSGLLAELVVRTYYESQGKPIYTVREELEGAEEQA